MHFSLIPRSNIITILIEVAILTAVLYFFPGPLHISAAIVGGFFGVLTGLCQLRAITLASHSLLAAQDAFQVRSALSSSLWGKASIALLWISHPVYILLPYFALGYFDLICWVTGYTGLVILRELIALPGLFWLAKQQPTPPTGTNP